MTTAMKSTSVNDAELARFAALADAWWDPKGQFRPLHQFNPLRIRYIKETLCAEFGRDAADPKALTGLTLLDVGCGGGLLCEPLARMGATVTGIDPGAEGVEAARLHAASVDLKIDYRAQTAEELRGSGATFDAVMAMEVIEHVNDPRSFIATCAELIAPEGLFFGATINRTPKAYALAIIGAERVLRWLPAGTHAYAKLVKPTEFQSFLGEAGFAIGDQVGTVFNPVSQQWALSRDLSVNYMLHAHRD